MSKGNILHHCCLYALDENILRQTSLRKTQLKCTHIWIHTYRENFTPCAVFLA